MNALELKRLNFRPKSQGYNFNDIFTFNIARKLWGRMNNNLRMHMIYETTKTDCTEFNWSGHTVNMREVRVRSRPPLCFEKSAGGNRVSWFIKEANVVKHCRYISPSRLSGKGITINEQ